VFGAGFTRIFPYKQKPTYANPTSCLVDAEDPPTFCQDCQGAAVFGTFATYDARCRNWYQTAFGENPTQVGRIKTIKTKMNALQLVVLALVVVIVIVVVVVIVVVLVLLVLLLFWLLSSLCNCCAMLITSFKIARACLLFVLLSHFFRHACALVVAGLLS